MMNGNRQIFKCFSFWTKESLDSSFNFHIGEKLQHGWWKYLEQKLLFYNRVGFWMNSWCWIILAWSKGAITHSAAGKTSRLGQKKCCLWNKLWGEKTTLWAVCVVYLLSNQLNADKKCPMAYTSKGDSVSYANPLTKLKISETILTQHKVSPSGERNV